MCSDFHYSDVAAVSEVEHVGGALRPDTVGHWTSPGDIGN